MRWDEDSLGLSLDKAKHNMVQRVNALLKGNAVRVLLGDGRDVAKGDGTKAGRGKGGKGTPIPWGKLRELCPLVDRDPSDASEVWSALSNAVAEQGKALVVEIATSGLARDDVKKAVREIVATHWTVRVAELRAVAAGDPENKNALRAVQGAEKTAAVWVDKVLKGTTPEPTKPEPKPETPDVQGKAGPAKEPTPEPKPEPKPEVQPRAVSLPAMAAAANVGDGADVARMFVEENSDPDGVLMAMLSALKGTNVLCKRSLRAVLAALTILHRETPPAVNVAPLNGQLVGAA
jgi:hypothetical protein